jgi:hypothetical protein
LNSAISSGESTNLIRPGVSDVAKRINIIGAQAKKINIVNQPKPRLDPAEIAEGLGAAPCGARISAKLDLISLAEIGTQLLGRLRSSGGRPALADATEICRVPLSTEDVKTLENMVAQIEASSGTKASVGQLVSAIVRSHLSAPNPAASTQAVDPPLSRSLLQNLIDEQLAPLREQVNRLERELHVAGANNK